MVSQRRTLTSRREAIREGQLGPRTFVDPSGVRVIDRDRIAQLLDARQQQALDPNQVRALQDPTLFQARGGFAGQTRRGFARGGVQLRRGLAATGRGAVVGGRATGRGLAAGGRFLEEKSRPPPPRPQRKKTGQQSQGFLSDLFGPPPQRKPIPKAKKRKKKLPTQAQGQWVFNPGTGSFVWVPSFSQARQPRRQSRRRTPTRRIARKRPAFFSESDDFADAAPVQRTARKRPAFFSQGDDFA